MRRWPARPRIARILPLVMNRKGYDEQTWFTFSYSPVRDESGRVAGMFCAVSETTQRVVAESALRESGARLRELNETLERRVAESLAERKPARGNRRRHATPSCRWPTSITGGWPSTAPPADEFERIFGVRPKVGASMLDMLADQPEHQAAVKAVWGRALGGEEFTAVEEFGDPARDRRAYEMRFNTLRDRDGTRIGAYQFVYDVTERLARPGASACSGGRASPGAEDGGARPADRRRGARLQQPAGGVRQRPAAAGAQPASAASPAVARRHAARRHARHRAYPAAARVLAAASGQRRIDRRRRPPRGHAGDARRDAGRTTSKSRCGSAPDIWPVEVDAGEMELAIVNLCVNARDAMPGGGADHHRGGQHPRRG